MVNVALRLTSISPMDKVDICVEVNLESLVAHEVDE